jgi:membrane-associated phospholipid phosphatase
MELLHSFEIIFNLVLQSLGNWLTKPMEFFTFLGEEEFFFLVMPVIYWCVDAALGLRLGLVLALSNAFNATLKLAFHSPRPYWIDPRVKALVNESSFGLPSGHAQTAAAMWGLIGAYAKRTWVVIFVILTILMIGVSRIYLGVHFLSDVLAGWFVGGLLLILVVRFDKKITAWIASLSFNQLLLACAASSLFIFASVAVGSAASEAWTTPSEWAINISAAGGDPIHPISPETAYTLGGTWLGLTVGAAWMFRKIGGFKPLPGANRRILSYLLGLAGVLIFWYGLGEIFPRQEDMLSFSLRFLRYLLVGLWVTAGAPWLFKRFGLVQ